MSSIFQRNNWLPLLFIGNSQTDSQRSTDHANVTDIYTDPRFYTTSLDADRIAGGFRYTNGCADGDFHTQRDVSRRTIDFYTECDRYSDHANVDAYQLTSNGDTLCMIRDQISNIPALLNLSFHH